MKTLFSWRFCAAGCLLSVVAVSAQAADISPALQQLVQNFLTRHPAVQAARAELQRAEADARAGAQSLYNPAVELEYEDGTDVTRTLALVQTLDWAGKRQARDAAGRDSTRAAQAALSVARQAMLNELLRELSGTVISGEAARLAEQRIEVLDEFKRRAERRYMAGDVGQSDVDLAHLALSEARMRAAPLVAEATAGEDRLAALVPMPAGGWPALPVLPVGVTPFDSEALLRQHPALRRAAAEASAARAGVAVAERDRRADPTVGLRGGQEGNDTLVGVNVSIPLYFRNTYRAEVDVANAAAVRTEQRYYSLLQRAEGQLQGAAQRYRVTRSALRDWEQGGQRRLTGRIDLLRRLWEAGEIDSTDYLVQLQQTFDTRASAVELRGAVWAAWLAWLDASGQTETWLRVVPAGRQ